MYLSVIAHTVFTITMDSIQHQSTTMSSALTSCNSFNPSEDIHELKRIVTNEMNVPNTSLTSSSRSPNSEQPQSNDDCEKSSLITSGCPVQPSPNSFEVMKKMKGSVNNLQPAEYQERMNQASAALALSALFSGGAARNMMKKGEASSTASTVARSTSVAPKLDGMVSESEDDRTISPQNSISNNSSFGESNGDQLHPSAKRIKTNPSASNTTASSGGQYRSATPYNFSSYDLPPPGTLPAPPTVPNVMAAPYPYGNVPGATWSGGFTRTNSNQQIASMIRHGSPVPFVHYNDNTFNNVARNHSPEHADLQSGVSNGPLAGSGGQTMTSRTISALHNKTRFTPLPTRENFYFKMNNHNQQHFNHHQHQQQFHHNHSQLHCYQNGNIDSAVTPSPNHPTKLTGDRNIFIAPSQHEKQIMNGSSAPYITPAKMPSTTQGQAVGTNVELDKCTNSSTQTTDPSSYNRRDKSLGVLCEHFIATYTSRYSEELKEAKNGDIPPALSIDEAAKSLGVERRRIYDIINILEALRVVSRKCKNMYYWYGLDGLADTFCFLQKDALLDVFPDEAKENGFILEKKVASNMFSKDSPPSGLEMLLAADQVQDESLNEMPDDHLTKKLKSDNSKEKSLAKLSQKFIQLFLVGNETLAMNDASNKILGPTLPKLPEHCTSEEEVAKHRANNAKLLKTKIRRLYDVANVLVSIGIIEKINAGNHLNNPARQRPTFRWTFKLSPTDLLNVQNEATRSFNSKSN